MNEVPPVVRQLRRERRARGLTQGEVAAQIPVSQAKLSYWELGKRDVSLTDLVRWAAVLGFRVELGYASAPDGPWPELTVGGLV